MNQTAVMERAPYENAGAATLAEQPVELPYRPQRKDKGWGVIFSHLEARLGMLRTWRYSWWAYWAELARFILPRRYKWLVTANTMDRGFPINQDIIDGKPTQAMQICASGLLSGMMSASRPWFALGLGIPGMEFDAEGKRWIEDTQERIYIVLAQSNFYLTFAQAFQDITVFGTAPVIIYEDFEDVIRCYNPCAGEYYLAAGARLDVDTLYREFTYTVAQCVEWFKLENCPDQIAKLWRQGGASLEMEFVIAHAIEPNFPLADRGALGNEIEVVPAKLPFREVYWLKGMKTDRELSRRGFQEKPFVAARWSQVSNDAYGRSPAMDALGDIKQLQQETRRKAEFIEKLVRPPMGADVEMKNEPASIMPGHVTYTVGQKGKEGFWPLFQVNPAALAPMVADIKDIQQRIDAFFFVDVFMMISQMEGVQPRNELEIAERKGEKIQRLGPMIEDFETQVAAPCITRVLAILERRRLLAPRPKSLQGVTLQIKYTSTMKLAQRAAETSAMEQGFRIGGALAQQAQLTGEPNPLRIVNLEESYRVYLERINFPERGIFSPEEVAAADKARAKQAAQAQALQLSKEAVGAAKALGETDVGGGQTAMGLITGLGGPRPGAQPS